MDLADLVPAVMKRLVLLARTPLVHFFVLGALLFAGKGLVGDARWLALAPEPITIAASEVERLRREWSAETGRAPSLQEMDALLRRHADEEALFREALRLGLDRTDSVVRARLLQNMRFVRGRAETSARALAASTAASADEGTLLREAWALGMSERDPVVRRRLLQAMQERIAADVRIDDDDVRAYVAAHPERYGAPGRYALRHIFLRGERAADEMQRATKQIESALAAGAVPAGDPFLLGRELGGSLVSLQRDFGPAFAEVVRSAAVGKWSGPVSSPYGVHFVFVGSITAASAPDIAEVGRQAHYALLAEREQEAVRAEMIRLRRYYPLETEWPAVARAGRS